MKVKNIVYLTPNQPVEVETELPLWLTLVVVGASVLVLEKVYYLLVNN